MNTQEVASQLVALCRAGRNIEAVETLLSADVQSIEATGDQTMPAVMNGRDAIRGKNQWWIDNHQIHSAKVKGPYPNGDRFAVIFDFDVTPAVGPMAGKRLRMEEVAVYTIADGKIAREEFFYDMSGASMDGGPAKPARRKMKAKPKPKPKKSAARSKSRKAAPKAPTRQKPKRRKRG